MLYYPQEDQVEGPPPNSPQVFDEASTERSNNVMFVAVIKARETSAKMWTESVDVISASHSGVGFYAQRECFVGQLISLLMPMPKELRRYDQDKKLYKIWGLVQHCNPLKGVAGFHIGVAFTGRTAPYDYAENPMISYRVSGVDPNGFWAISESDTPFRMRRHSRFWSSTDVVLTAINSNDAEGETEKTITENISESGASVFSNLQLNVGDRVKITSAEHNFNATAMVRSRLSGRDQRLRLHLEFVDRTFPIAEISSDEGGRQVFRTHDR